MTKIVPALLHDNFKDFKNKLNQVESFAEHVQIDVMDGVFVPTKSFSEIDQINNLKSNLKLELHLMVKHPLQELEKWSEVKNIFRVIFHIESADKPQEVINYIRGKCWQVGIALNPDTDLSKIEPYLKVIDLVLFMTVYPGRQGALFVPKVLAKIKEIAQKPEHPLVAVDGGINKKNIVELQQAGVEIFNVGSALTLATNPQKAYDEIVAVSAKE